MNAEVFETLGEKRRVLDIVRGRKINVLQQCMRLVNGNVDLKPDGKIKIIKATNKRITRVEHF